MSGAWPLVAQDVHGLAGQSHVRDLDQHLPTGELTAQVVVGRDVVGFGAAMLLHARRVHPELAVVPHAVHAAHDPAELAVAHALREQGGALDQLRDRSLELALGHVGRSQFAQHDQLPGVLGQDAALEGVLRDLGDQAGVQLAPLPGVAYDLDHAVDGAAERDLHHDRTAVHVAPDSAGARDAAHDPAQVRVVEQAQRVVDAAAPAPEQFGVHDGLPHCGRLQADVLRQDLCDRGQRAVRTGDVNPQLSTHVCHLYPFIW